MKNKNLLVISALVVLLCLAVPALWLLRLASTLPDVSRLKRYRPPAAAEVLDRNGQLLTHYSERALRFWVPIDGVPERVVRAVVIAEDDTFFEHQGVNYKATWDALVVDVKKRRFARGGSTITQQMIKNVFLSKEKTIVRKLREYLLARRAEELLTKREILQIYLNEVEWGEDLYGIEAASRFYFDKHAGELSVGEAALLAGMLPNPRAYNPFKHPDKARDRRDQVLSNMVQARVITEDEFAAAIASAPALRGVSARFEIGKAEGGDGRPCYQRVLERVLLEAYGAQGLYREGRRIATTLDKARQETLRVREASAAGPTPTEPEQVVVVKQGAEIRAIACGTAEASMRSWLGAEGEGGADVTVAALPLSALTAKDLLREPANP